MMKISQFCSAKTRSSHEHNNTQGCNKLSLSAMKLQLPGLEYCIADELCYNLPYLIEITGLNTNTIIYVLHNMYVFDIFLCHYTYFHLVAMLSGLAL